jgi:peptide-methionine (S)-S-oxide reductase
VGYAGGTTPSPTYHRLGDHSETIEIDYDPRQLTYDDLLAVFFDSHMPSHPAFSVQYRSAIFYRTPAERQAAESAIERVRSSVGNVFTAVEQFTAFHSAEDYHQKYGVRRYPDLTREFMGVYSSDSGFRDSTAVARVNGWLSGCGSAEQIERELPRTGLSDAAQSSVRSRALPGGRPRIGCGA